jgi:hypothetical protein
VFSIKKPASMLMKATYSLVYFSAKGRDRSASAENKLSCYVAFTNIAKNL